jgi:predicted Fe-Mo cluster-binding NifX family protein
MPAPGNHMGNVDMRKGDVIAYEGKGMSLAEFLVERGIDILYTKEDFKGKGPEHIFSGAEVEVRKTDKKTLKELMISEQ